MKLLHMGRRSSKVDVCLREVFCWKKYFRLIWNFTPIFLNDIWKRRTCWMTPIRRRIASQQRSWMMKNYVGWRTANRYFSRNCFFQTVLLLFHYYCNCNNILFLLIRKNPNIKVRFPCSANLRRPMRPLDRVSESNSATARRSMQPMYV